MKDRKEESVKWSFYSLSGIPVGLIEPVPDHQGMAPAHDEGLVHPFQLNPEGIVEPFIDLDHMIHVDDGRVVNPAENVAREAVSPNMLMCKTTSADRFLSFTDEFCRWSKFETGTEGRGLFLNNDHHCTINPIITVSEIGINRRSLKMQVGWDRILLSTILPFLQIEFVGGTQLGEICIPD